MIANYKYAVITDVGSTATKAILLDIASQIPSLIALASHPTTVELPQNDVCIGIREACKALEEKAEIRLFEDA
jgi:activator of 2-hydroxyglutaryl-CoA dehydratase